jgi:biotin carboxylase
MTTRAIDLVMVGYRPGALHAASRLGLRVALIEEGPPSRAAAARITCAIRAPLEGEPQSLVDAVQQVLGDATPRAVVSVGERGVLGAAALRGAYGLSGVDSETARRARDKPTMKAAARARGVACTDWREIDADTQAAALVSALDLPVVLKHRAGAGSRDLVIARDEQRLTAALDSIPAAERTDWMAERFVAGVEMSVESFVSGGEIQFTNPTEYYVPAFANIAPAALPPAELEEILDLNRRALAALDIRIGMTHLELFRTPAGPVFGEVAVRPPGGRIMRILRRAYDFDPWEALLRLELGQPFPFPAKAIRAGGIWMLHPGAGRVLHARGMAAAKRVKGVRKLVCRIRAGDIVKHRESTGSDIGWLEVGGKDRDEVAARMQRAYDALDIQMAPLTDPA